MKRNPEMGETATQPEPAQTADLSISGLRLVASPCKTMKMVPISHVNGPLFFTAPTVPFQVFSFMLIGLPQAGSFLYLMTSKLYFLANTFTRSTSDPLLTEPLKVA